MNFKLKLGKMSLGTDLEFDGNPNASIYLSGVSGQGKSWEARDLVMQIPSNEGRGIVFDITGDFVRANPKQGWDPSKMDVINIRDKEYKMNPFVLNDGESMDDMVDRVVNLIDTAIKLSPGQWAYLFDTITEACKEGSMRSMADLINRIREESRVDTTAARLLPKIRSVGRLLPNGEKEIDWKVDIPGITIVDLSTIKDRGAKRILIEVMLAAICDLRMNGTPGGQKPLVVVLDECQLLRFRDDSQEVRILREGRKFGLFGWFATQWTNDKNALSALGQAGLHIYFRPAEEDLHKTALKLAHGDRKRVAECEKRLSRLQVGQFMYASGQRLIVSSPV